MSFTLSFTRSASLAVSFHESMCEMNITQDQMAVFILVLLFFCFEAYTESFHFFLRWIIIVYAARAHFINCYLCTI